MSATQQLPRWLSLQAHPQDNVAIVVNDGGAPPGATFQDGMTAIEHIPQGHKIALQALRKGAAVRRLGAVIGTAADDIARGAWVSEQLLEMPTAPELAALDLTPQPPAAAAPLEGYTFQGYRNRDGSVGTRNILGIMTSVQCVVGVLGHAVARIRAELLPKYPNVDDVVAINHVYGCGVAITAPEAIIPIRTLRNIARSPNFGGQALIVGLGCEKLAPERLLPDDASADDSGIYRLQEASLGFADMVGSIMQMAEERLRHLDTRRRETVPASELVVGMQCGGSDAFSGVTANPGLGIAADLLVRAGATVMFSENTEVRDGIHLLVPRAANAEVAKALVREMAWYDAYLARGQADRSANTTPGNKKGGLANIVEKAMGSIAKSGSSPINGVVPPGERVKGRGLQYCATPASDFVCGTLQVAAGMNLHVFTTGRGTPYGLGMVPVIKVATRTELAQRWSDLMDIDAGGVASGAKTLDQLGWELLQRYLDVASGQRTWTEQHRLHNDLALFNPAPIT
ncbi:galactarate dehydratase [Xanthomonas campestris]|uniref:galactarate dehydratase n=1 Tax=Xanthomonas campestris TaxID=339 RepID=UPI0009C0160A|nr:galactarate dehydratase [Xanthomonas campestris]MEB1151044.1 galactarate dehydratase [Xanthomonas campestris pv. campestris]WDI99824.1 galactarate dehydratase [Xanthomonas campestris pv. incanae]MEA9581735.1 galactarate dehydratase [Xanthomonas campestris]MEA9590330.1 galactarate dehydratase [Xanthomonas campestris]MEA9621632.1 galactarate dehydratase [Xanthomonas campestris]